MIQVEVNPETGGIHFFDKLGQLLLTDKDSVRLSCWIRTK